MMLMMPQAASVLGCERLWLNISATLIFLCFHAGSRLTIGVASWTWNSSAVALDLKRKLVTKSCIASFLDTNLCPKTGRYKISPAFKFTVPAGTFRPCSTFVSCLGWFFPRSRSSSSSSSSSRNSSSSSKSKSSTRTRTSTGTSTSSCRRGGGGGFGGAGGVVIPLDR